MSSNYAPPEYIIEHHDKGDLFVIFDPVTGGDYFSFWLNENLPIETIKTQISSAMRNAEDIFYTEILEV